MASTFDDEELSMSLSGAAADRRGQRPAPPRPSTESRDAASPAAKIPNDRSTAQRIGVYEVKRTLGEGSFGKVKLATHRFSGQEVALKIITRKKLISKDMAGRVEREIQYLQLLRHPHIIKLYVIDSIKREEKKLTVIGILSSARRPTSSWCLNMPAENSSTIL